MRAHGRQEWLGGWSEGQQVNMGCAKYGARQWPLSHRQHLWGTGQSTHMGMFICVYIQVCVWRGAS